MRPSHKPAPLKGQVYGPVDWGRLIFSESLEHRINYNGEAGYENSGNNSISDCLPRIKMADNTRKAGPGSNTSQKTQGA